MLHRAYRYWMPLLALFLAPAAANLFYCVPEGEEFDENRDYFPHKVEVEDSQFWEIEYYNNYKVVRNEIATSSEEFVLYQCGTPRPTIEQLREEVGDDIDPTHILPVPLQDGIALSSTTHITLLELLGLRQQIKAWIGWSGGISSPCLKQLIEDGEIVVIESSYDTDAVNSIKDLVGPNIVSFHNNREGWGSDLLNVTASAYKESFNKEIGEWIKFFAVFFNKELEASRLHSFASARYDCTATEAARNVASSDGVRPTLIWASWVDYAGTQGWSVGKSPTYYSEFAEECSADLITSRAGTIPFYGDMLFTTEDFVALAQEADHWIYTSYNWDTVSDLHANALAGFKSVQNRQVFDTNGAGPNDWFEQRVAEYDVVLEDFCSVVGTADPLHQRVWLRNVFTETLYRNAVTTCDDPAAPVVPRFTPCRIETPSPILCFSGENSVNIKTSSSPSIISKKLKDVKIGDKIQTGESTYEKVYAFGHFQPTKKTPYLQLFFEGNSAPLEISEQHMVFQEDRAIPASHLKIGDRLMSDGPIIKSIKHANGIGAFAPFTHSGTVMINGVKASSYVSLQNTEYLEIAGFSTGLTHQWAAHAFELPHRIWCLLQTDGVCTNERYDSDGLSADWVALPFHFSTWLLNQTSWLQLLLGTPLVLIFLLLGCVSMLTTGNLCICAGTLTLLFVVRRMPISYNVYSKQA